MTAPTTATTASTASTATIASTATTATTASAEASASAAGRIGGPENRPVAALILPAGGGSRLGGVVKALLSHDGELLVDRAVRVARQGGCGPVVVVLGAEAESVRRQADALAGCVVVDNPDWPTGMGSSLRSGLAAVPADCSAVAVLLVDQPFVGSGAVRAVLDAHSQGADIVSATYRERRAHPVLFAAEHWDAVARSAVGDQGARSFLREREDDIVTVPCDAFGDARDVDSPADLRLLRAGHPV